MSNNIKNQKNNEQITEDKFKFDLIMEMRKNYPYMKKLKYIDDMKLLSKNYFDFPKFKSFNNFNESYNSPNKNVFIIFDLNSYNSMTLLEKIKRNCDDDLLDTELQNLLENSDIVYCDNYEMFQKIMFDTTSFKQHVQITYGTLDKFKENYGDIVPTILCCVQKTEDIEMIMEHSIIVINEDSILDFIDEIYYLNEKTK